MIKGRHQWVVDWAGLEACQGCEQSPTSPFSPGKETVPFCVYSKRQYTSETITKILLGFWKIYYEQSNSKISKT